LHADLAIKLRGRIPKLDVDGETRSCVKIGGSGLSIRAQSGSNTIGSREAANVVDGCKKLVVSRILRVALDTFLIFGEPFAESL
jgi:hypothetical protein